jgi:hypothetical protein
VAAYMDDDDMAAYMNYDDVAAYMDNDDVAAYVTTTQFRLLFQLTRPISEL